MTLTPGAIAELHWWDCVLDLGVSARCQVEDDAVLTLTWGDGSGTGTGGTTEFIDGEGQHMGPMETWMGAWTPRPPLLQLA